MKCFNNLCRFRTEDNRCEGAPVPPEECRLHETLIAKKAPVFEVLCSVGLSVLLQDAKDQFRWFEENANEKGISGLAKHYRQGSRDAYSYMVSAILEAINR